MNRKKEWGKVFLLFLVTATCACTFNEKKHDDKQTAKEITAADTLLVPRTGDKYIDLAMENTQGEMVKLSDHIGNKRCVLIDCWASWCGPCLADMPALVNFYKKNHKNGFEIVGVSFDKNIGQWIDAINGLSMVWPQMSDLKGWSSSAAKVYGIQSLPYTILLDRDGKIIAIGLRGNELFEKIEQVLKTNSKM